MPGARLYTETRGSGPLLLMIVGGSGDPTSYAVGRASRAAGTLPALPVQALAARLRRPVAELPGGHVGYAEHPAEFAAGLDALLRGHLPEQGDDGLEGCAGAS